MVSHSQIFERTPAYRAPSTSSRSVTSRRHRSSRSHSGGTSSRQQNEFPNFAQTGDVEIIIIADGQEKRYLLHRLILAQNSGFFEASTSEDWSKAQPSRQGAGHSNSHRSFLGSISEDDRDSGEGASSLGLRNSDRLRWRYELDWGNKDEEIPMLVQRQPQSTLFGGEYNSQPPAVPNKPNSSQSGFLRSVSNYSAMQSASYIASTNPQNSGPESDIIRDYDNLFRIFYNYPPTLDAVNIAESYIQCKSLLNVADMYDALEVVGPRIDHHLLQFQGRLWKQIAKYPPSYLKLGYLARSKVIFAEALVHVVGQWPSGSNQLRHTVPDHVIDLIEDKVDELAERRMRAEARLYRITLTTARGDRVSPTNAYVDWLAISFFRQWLTDNTTPPPPIPKTGPANNNNSADSSRHNSSSSQQPAGAGAAKAPLSTGAFFRLLATAGTSYLTHEECKRFLRSARLALSDDHSSTSGGNGGGNSGGGGGSSRDREALKKFEKRMDEIKTTAKDIVKPLTRHYLELDVARDAPGGRLAYLTCTKVEEEDFPWD